MTSDENEHISRGVFVRVQCPIVILFNEQNNWVRKF